MSEIDIDWGCPNWLNADAYGDFSCWDERKWRWEFQRRTHSFRVGFQFRLYSQLGKPADIGHQRLIDPRVESYIFGGRLMWKEEFRHTFIKLDARDAASYGLLYLPNPLYSDSLEHCDAATSNLFESLDVRTVRYQDIVDRELNEYGETDLLGVLQIAVIFAPNNPIAPQLEGLQEHIMKYRNSSYRKDLKRKHIEKWFRYLRILDAREQGASWSVCAEALLTGTASTPQTAADTYKQAVRTRDGL